jgi:hypothetical protein
MFNFIKKNFVLTFVIILGLLGGCLYLVYGTNLTRASAESTMILIEFEGMEGLENMTKQMYERDIPGVLIVDADFLQENCEGIKALQDLNIEIGGVYPAEPFWDMTYDQQREIMVRTKEVVESCTGNDMRIFASKYFAYTEDTVKIAEELGIEYVFARGTTGAKATIYQPNEYGVKIFSVSNVGSEKWGTGSLCDYSYWAREGTPEDFREELFNAVEEFSFVSPVSHTYLGGKQVSWNRIYLDFFDNANVNWMSIDNFHTDYIVLDFSDIPANKEVLYDEVTYTEDCDPNDPNNVCEVE